MKRGFPRPRETATVEYPYFTSFKSETASSPDEDQEYGYVTKTWPVPYTSDEGTVASLNQGRLDECHLFSLCIVCGLKVDTETCSVCLSDGKLHAEAGPFHEKCARLTEVLCPATTPTNGYIFQHGVNRLDALREIRKVKSA